MKINNAAGCRHPHCHLESPLQSGTRHWLDEEISALIGIRHRQAPLRSALDSWQAEALWRTVAAAHRESLFYRKHWHGHKAVIAAWEKAGPCSLDDARAFLHQLPLCSGDDITNDAGHFLAVSHNDVAGLTTVPSSGTTGKPKRIFCSAHDLERTVRFFQYGMRYMVAPDQSGTDDAGDRVVMLMSGEREGSVGDLFSRAMNRWHIPCHVVGLPRSIDELLAALQQLQPTCIVGFPVHVLRLAQVIAALPLQRERLVPNLRTVLLSADASTPELRRYAQDALHCEVFDHYGLTEVGYAVAVECAAHNGCHIREGDVLFSVVDEAGNNIAPGQWGEVVLTTLNRQAMPLVRYKTGDRGRVLYAPCPCGSALHRLEVAGRLENSLALPGGGRLTTAHLDFCCYALPWVASYEAELCATEAFFPHWRAEDTADQPLLHLRVALDPSAPADATVLLQKRLELLDGVEVIPTGQRPEAMPGNRGARLPLVFTVFPCDAKKSRLLPGPKSCIKRQQGITQPLDF